MNAALLTSVPPLLLIAIGLPLNAAAGLVSLRNGAVDAGGAIAGTVLGAVVFAAGGPFLWILLAVFFVSSTVLTRFRGGEKEWLTSIQQKGGRRDAFQVIANGGAGMAAALLSRVTEHPGWAIGCAAAFAAANADTWASEIGILSRRDPVSILTLRPVPRGVSGGVSAAGLSASLAGAFLIALFFVLTALAAGQRGGVGTLIAIVTGGGLFGSLLDSALGSTLQAQYEGRKTVDGRSVKIVTERKTTNGAPNRLVRGVPFVTNDVVNLASSSAAALAAILLYWLSGGNPR